LDPLRKSYRPFKGRIPWKNFLNKLNSFSYDKKWNFVRSSLLYQEAKRYGKSNPNIGMLLLCSCADAMKVAGKNAGSRRNFKQFYIRYCPTNLRDPPIEYYPNARPPLVKTPFDKALDFIYVKFRCLYVHEGIGRLQPLPSGITWIALTLLDKYCNEYYVVDTLKILNWFSTITMESLYNIL